MRHPQNPTRPTPFQHPRFTRRFAIQAGAIGLLGLAADQLAVLRSARAGASSTSQTPARSVLYIFLSGGLAQHDSFDLKPDAPEEIRGEFRPIATATPGIEICEHLPMLARRSHLWALVRSLTHPSNEHSAGHHIMLTGRSDLPAGFDASRPRPGDWPAIASVVGSLCRSRNNLPPAIVLPERLVHNTGRVIPGQFAGIMGLRRDPWFIEASPFDPRAYGAFPEYEFDHQERPHQALRQRFEAPSLTLPEGFGAGRLAGRLRLLEAIDEQRSLLERAAESGSFETQRHSAISLLTDPKVRRAFDVEQAEPGLLDRYGRNSFGWSLLMARRLVEADVPLVQVNLGNNETWDTHGNAFPHLKDKLFPPTDRASRPCWMTWTPRAGSNRP